MTDFGLFMTGFASGCLISSSVFFILIGVSLIRQARIAKLKAEIKELEEKTNGYHKRL